MSDYMPECAVCEHFDSCIMQKHITEMALILWNISREKEKEVVRGEWIDKPTKGVRYICSRCTGRFDYQWRYCPNCGAKMKGEREGE